MEEHDRHGTLLRAALRRPRIAVMLIGSLLAAVPAHRRHGGHHGLISLR